MIFWWTLLADIILGAALLIFAVATGVGLARVRKY